jgi:hypothetical protein
LAIARLDLIGPRFGIQATPFRANWINAHRALNRNKRCAGLQITIYDPTLDPDGRCASLITELLVSALA